MREHVQAIVDSAPGAIAKTAGAITYTASGATVVGTFTMNEWLGLGGFLIALSSFFFTVWFKMKYQRPNKKPKKEDK